MEKALFFFFVSPVGAWLWGASWLKSVMFRCMFVIFVECHRCNGGYPSGCRHWVVKEPLFEECEVCCIESHTSWFCCLLMRNYQYVPWRYDVPTRGSHYTSWRKNAPTGGAIIMSHDVTTHLQELSLRLMTSRRTWRRNHQYHSWRHDASAGGASITSHDITTHLQQEPSIPVMTLALRRQQRTVCLQRDDFVVDCTKKV